MGLADDLPQSLTDQCVAWVRDRIESGALSPGMRLPSIRSMARSRGVSPFTVAEAYGRLEAMGLVRPRAGSGVYVCEREPADAAPRSEPAPPIDMVWLLRNMLAEGGRATGPGMGVLPQAWLDGAQLGGALRAIGREASSRLVGGGSAQGYAPLREVLQGRLAELGVGAAPDQIVLTTGITHAINLVIRRLLKPGDTVLVGDPSWFGALGLLAVNGMRAVGAPFGPEGPDLAAMERLAAEHRPRLMILNPVAHNPTGTTVTPAAAARILEIARRFDFHILEDDVYADLCDPGLQASRLAGQDQLDRVIYAGSFSKTLAANVRVGFLACERGLAQGLTDTKVLTGYTTPELNERLVHKLLVEGRYRRHAASLRQRLDEAREAAAEALQARGLPLFVRPEAGMFLWVDVGADAQALAEAGRVAGLVAAPGALFSPTQAPSTWMRFNVTTRFDARLDRFLKAARAG